MIDGATLKGVELFINFEGKGYKTSLRAPLTGNTKRYVFNLTNMADKGLQPDYVSVAPIFLEGGKDIVGSITSNLIIPYSKIALDVETLVLNIDDLDIVTLNSSVLELDLTTCPQEEVEDPWGGCAVANGDLTNVTKPVLGNDKYAWASGELDADWSGSKYVLFSYDGSNNNCLNEISKTVCFALGVGDVATNYFNVGVTENLTVASPCNSGSEYYVYDNSNCE